MAQQNENVCKFNKYGFCKFRSTCRIQDNIEICSKIGCEIDKCSLRHHKVCRYYRDIGYCKYGEWCLFKHESKVSKEINDVVKKIDSNHEKYDSNLKILIAKLEEKIKTFETKLDEISILHWKKIEELEKTIENSKTSKTSEKLDNKIKDIEEIQTNLIEESGNYKCNECDFETYYKRGLKIHKKKMHKVYSCGDCEEIFDTQRDFKVHSYTHSYSSIEKKKVKCNNCEFESNSLNTIEVHVGWCRQKDFECGLCGIVFSDKEDLEIHLRTCEMYECDSYTCWVRGKNLSDMKKHIEEKHESSTLGLLPLLNHLKIDRKDKFNVTSTSYSLKDL